MDQEISVPQGWSRTVLNGRVLYVAPAPFSVKIYSQAELVLYQKKGRFLNIKGDQLVFGTKRKKKEKKYVSRKKGSSNCGAGGVQEADAGGFLRDEGEGSETRNVQGSEGVVTEFDGVEEAVSIESDWFAWFAHSAEEDNAATSSINNSVGETQTESKQRKKKDVDKKMDDEHAKITDAVSKLTLDPKRKLNHASVLEVAARRLNDERLRRSGCRDSQNVDELKRAINECKTEDEIARILWLNPEFQSRFSSLFSSKLLEQVMSLGNLSANPMKSFPVDINTNLYADIVHFGLDHAPDVILLLLNLTKKHETPISARDVLEVGFSFSTLAESCSSQNKALKKIKSICLRSSGLTNAGLDSMASVGATETSRSFRNDRDLLASISEEIVKQYAKKGTAQFTFDNLDICINKIQHHLTLNYLE